MPGDRLDELGVRRCAPSEGAALALDQYIDRSVYSKYFHRHGFPFSEAAMRTLITLGPEGTCHERATREYMRFQGVKDYEVQFIGDFMDGLERIRGRDDAFLVQCSAHPKVHEVTERYWSEIFVVDTFIYPTKALAVLARHEVERPRTLGLVPATAGYIDPGDWEETIDVQSKPIVAEELLAGRYEAGLTHLEHLAAHPDELRLVEEIGEIDTTWVVYGTRKRFKGEVIGIPSSELFSETTPVPA